jgi:DNA end-binding protein Ku
MARPTWSGPIQISLVSIDVKIFPASNPARQIEFHQIDRKTGHRVRHQNVDDGEAVAAKNVVNGYEYAKGKYIEIEPEELKQLRIPTAKAMQIHQFVKWDEISPVYFDRPYFVAAKDGVQAKALNVMRKALAETKTFGIGEIAFSGREHLLAIGAPLETKQKGLMLYTLRYGEEQRKAQSVMPDEKETKVEAQELSLAKQLINGSTSAFDVSEYKNDYEAAVKKLIDAKRKGKGKPLPKEEAPVPQGKVINIMDALRGSLKKTPKARKTQSRRSA